MSKYDREPTNNFRWSKLILAMLAIYIVGCAPLETSAQTIDAPRASLSVDSPLTLQVLPVHHFQMAETLEEKQVSKNFAHQLTFDCAGKVTISNNTGSILVSTDGILWNQPNGAISVSSQNVLYITTKPEVQTANYTVIFSFSQQ